MLIYGGDPSGRSSAPTPRSRSWSGPVDDAVRELAREAGIATDWIDAAERPQRVSIGSLRSILAALGYPCASRTDIAESRARLRALSNDARAVLHRNGRRADRIEPRARRTEPSCRAIDRSRAIIACASATATSRSRSRRRAASRSTTSRRAKSSTASRSSSIRCGAAAKAIGDTAALRDLVRGRRARRRRRDRAQPDA